MRIFCFVFLSLIAIRASAFVELNTFYSTDQSKFAAVSASTSTYFDLGIGFAVDKKMKYQVGWNYTSQTQVTTQTGNDSKYSATQMGPRFLISLDKNNHWTVGLSYNLKTEVSQTVASVPLKLKGSGYKVDIGYGFELSESVRLGLRMNYNVTTLTEQLDAAEAYSKVSYSKTLIYPSLYYIWLF